MNQESGEQKKTDGAEASWGWKLFVATLIGVLAFFWWLLIYSGGVVVHHG